MRRPPGWKRTALVSCAAVVQIGLEAARALPPDSILMTGAAQSRYAIAIAEYHACLASH